jgi:hypothetical protein
MQNNGATSLSDQNQRQFRGFLFFPATIMPKPAHIGDLERRQHALENEIAKALLHHSPDDPMIADLKRRMLHLIHELDRLHHQAVRDRRLH